MQYLLILLLFFFSGFASLVLEVTWSRQIGLLFGHTVQASSIVLAAYFTGLTIGYLIGRKLTGVRNPLRAYGICEIAAGLWALVIPSMIGYASTNGIFLLADSPAGLLLSRALFSMVLLLPATIAMGATLPFIAATLERSRDLKREKKIVLAYAVNTAGAVAGTIIVTTFLIMLAGVTGSSIIGSTIALVVGALAIGLSLTSRFGTEPAPPVTKKKTPVAWERYALAGISGFATLALQVLFVRLFSLVFHNSVYSFGTVLIAFLLSLSLASVIFSRFKDQLQPKEVMASLQQIGGIAVTTAVLCFLLFTGLDYFGEVGSFSVYMLSCITLTTATILIPVTICGMLLPWTWLHPDRNTDTIAEDLGSLSAVNTGAAVAGSIVTCFVLLPTIGLWSSFGLIASLYIISGLIITGFRMPVKKYGFSVLALTFVWAAMAVAAKQNQGPDEGEIVKRYESAYGWVDVIKMENSNLKLRQNIHYGLGSSSSISMEKRQGHIPLLLHPNPEKVLFVGLATGITASAALDHSSVQKIDVVELLPDVVKAAGEFAEFNNNLLTNPKTSIIVNDGRHYLNQTDQMYDLIISDLFVPWESMTGYLYTVDHYQAAIKKLNPGGMFAQWLPLWQVSNTEFEMIADSMATVFPYTNIFYGKNDFHWTILGMIGSKEPISIDSELLANRLAAKPASHAKDKSWFNSADNFLEMYIGTWKPKESAVLNTDEFPVVEFSTPISAWTKERRLRFATLASYRESVLNSLPFDGGLVVDQKIPSQSNLRNLQNSRFKSSED